MSKKELVDISAIIQAETDLAWLLYDGSVEQWVPKSKVENNNNGTFTMPEWLAQDKGFI